MTDKSKKERVREFGYKISPAFHIEADGGGGLLSVLVSGVVGIGDFSDKEIKLITKRESLKISGDGIKLSVFEQKTVEITGKVENISICLKKRRGEK